MMKRTILIILAIFMSIFSTNIVHSALTDGLTGYLGFNGNYTDALGVYNATATSGGTTVSSDGGKIGGAVTMGSSSYVNWGSIPLGNGDHTFNCWFDVTSFASGTGLWDRNNAPYKKPISVVANSDGNLQLIMGTGSANTVIMDNSNPAGNFFMPENEWVMVSITQDVDTQNTTMYVNGVYNRSTTTTYTSTDDTSKPFNLGFASGVYLTGSADECGVWDRPLSQSEIVELYNSGSGLAYPFTTCTEDWVGSNSSCSVADETILTYTDQNTCGTFEDLPVDNGTVSACNYCDSTYENTNSSCLVTDLFNVNYDYTNSCCADTGLPSDCNIPSNTTESCNYCTLSTSEHQTGCNGVVNVTYYVNENPLTCCDMTGIPADCDLPANVTEACSICQEDWVEHTTSCTNLDNQTLYYLDENDCGTYGDLPVGNGTIQSCNFCTSVWSSTVSCLNALETTTYEYSNNCCQLTGLPSDCNIPSNTSGLCSSIGTHSASEIAPLTIDVIAEAGLIVLSFVTVIVIILGLGWVKTQLKR